MEGGEEGIEVGEGMEKREEGKEGEGRGKRPPPWENKNNYVIIRRVDTFLRNCLNYIFNCMT